jgi:hypothetical protein
MPDPWQFNTDRTYPGRWSITFSNPPMTNSWPRLILIFRQAPDRWPGS